MIESTGESRRKEEELASEEETEEDSKGGERGEGKEVRKEMLRRGE